MSHRSVFFLSLAAALLVLAGCRRSAGWPPEPAPIQFGEDACAACSMIISDPSYAAQIRGRRGEVQIFDDIGCMLSKSSPDTDPAGVFVRGYDGSGWIRGDRAYVLRAQEIASPMGYGWAAFADRPQAEAAARVHGDAVVLELRGLLGAPPERAARSASAQSDTPMKGEVRE